MSRRHKKHASPENHERWLITYADLITLLMVFFVVLYAMSQIDASKFKTLSISLSTAMYNSKTIPGESGGDKGVLKSFSSEPVKDPSSGKETNTAPNQTISVKDQAALKREQQEQENLQAVVQQLKQYIQQQGLSNFLMVELNQEGIQVTLKDVALFDTGSADLKPDARKILAGLSPFLNLDQVKDHEIKVEGHSDNRPISTPQYPSNWFLSSARATNVVSFFQSQSIDPARLSAVGYGEYRPIAPNDTAENQAKNRRVNVIILRK